MTHISTAYPPAAPAIPAPQAEPVARRTSFAPGEKLAACYVLRRRVEIAPDETVWLAYDEVLGKEVSLHFLPPAIRNDVASMEALRQEIKHNRQFIHPHILRIYDLIEEGEWAAIAMEAFEGDSLAAILRRQERGFFEAAQLKTWLAALCQTLEDAHKIQLVHRDVAPANIFIDKSGKILLAKFGVSRLMRDALNRLVGGTESESGLAYVSPQQLDGARATPADDIYAFGVLLCELLSGKVPFCGKELAQQIRSKVPVSVEARRAQLKQRGGVIPPAWERVIATCLEKKPEQRPGSMAKIASELGVDGVVNRGMPALVASAVPPPTKPPAPAVPGTGEGLVGAGAPKTEPRTPERGAKPVAEPRTEQSSLVSFKSAPIAEIKAEPAPRTQLESPAKCETKAKSPKGQTELQTNPQLESALVEKAVPDHYPSFEPRRAGFPLTWLAAGAVVIMFGLYGIFFHSPARLDAGAIATPQGDSFQSEFTPVANPDDGSAAEESRGFAGTGGNEKAKTDAAAAPDGRGGEPPQSLTAAAAARAAADPTVTAKTTALEKARQDAEAAEKAHAEMLKQKEEAETAMAQAQKALDEKKKAAAPIVRAGEQAAAERKTREEEMRVAEAAAQQAQQVAAEKARMAEEAKKNFTNVEKSSKEKIATQQKAESEVSALDSSLEAKRRQAADLAQAVSAANTRREEQAATVKRTEQELANARMVAQKAAEEALRQAIAKRRAIEAQIAETRAMFEKKMAELENSLKSSEAGLVPSPATTTPKTEPPASGPAPKPAPSSNEGSGAAVKAPSAETLPALKTATPEKGATTASAEPKKAQGAQDGFENSLGMRFAAVGNVLFSVWETRVKDFEAFAHATNLRSTIWKDPGFRQGPEHPVVNVTWRDAMAFCGWLTSKERKEGLLAANQEYRLPTDLEWSKAVGLPDESGKSPDARDVGVPDVYPWGRTWPPPKGAGNFTGEETGSDIAIKGYDDGFAWTAPVGSFAPNTYGLYDMGGNVLQWCMDSWNAEQKTKVLRGSSWYNGAIKLSLLSSCRIHSPPDSSTDNYGFRCVVASVDPDKTVKR